jgi:hypothetical protein
MNTRPKINFYAKSTKGITGLIVSVAVNNLRLMKVVPDIRIKAKYWDNKKQKIKPNYPDDAEAKKINEDLVKLEQNLFTNLSTYKIEIRNREQLSHLVNNYMRNPIPVFKVEDEQLSFFEYYERYLLVARNEVSWGFLRHQKSTMKKLMEFEEYLGKRLTFESFTVDCFDEFYAFLLSTGTEENGIKKGIHNNSTINGHIKRIKIFLSTGKIKKWHNSTDFRDYKRKRRVSEDEGAIIRLTWEEFLKLYNYQFDKEHLEKVKDVFCFSCVTGLRFSDYALLTKQEFKIITALDSKGNTKRLLETFILKNRKRTSVKLPFSDYAFEITEKYRDTANPLLLPVVENNIMNKYLKEIGEILGFDEMITSIYYRGGTQIKTVKEKWKMLTSHSGRKTFICKNVEEGVPLHVVASYTGHSKNSKALSRYYEITDKMKIDFIPDSLYSKHIA